MAMDLQLSLRNTVHRIQRKLAFEDWKGYTQFETKDSLGRAGLIGCILGLVGGIHLTLLCLCCFHFIGIFELPLPARTLGFLTHWCAYAVSLCTFHLLEFFVTAIYNPTVANADSYLVNHSTAYTVAAITSWLEFFLRWLLLGANFGSSAARTVGWDWHWTCVGLLVVVLGQTLRSLAMATAGESFHHLIQLRKNDRHVLITHGIYTHLRHPSYTGFFYWSVGTQVLLGNWLHTFAFFAASWTFFRRRIPYEEETLCRHFPSDYPAYRDRTYIGIPLLDWAIRRDRDGNPRERGKDD